MVVTGADPMQTWKNREEKVLGWSGHLDELSLWAAGGSLKFSVEIQHSSRWPGPVKWSALSGLQQSCSTSQGERLVLLLWFVLLWFVCLGLFWVFGFCVVLWWFAWSFSGTCFHPPR